MQGQASGPYTATLNLLGGTAITGGTIGLELDGANTRVAGNALGNLSFSGQGGDYITLANGVLAGQALDATGVTFDGVDPSDANLSDLYGVENKITDALNDASLGLVRVRSGEVYVSHQDGSIQRGIDAASSGDTVNVQAGTYIGQVAVHQNVTISGQGDSTVIQAPATLVNEFTTSAANDPIVYFTGITSGNINNVKIDGLGLGTANYRFEGIAYYDAGGTVDQVMITGIRDNPLDGTQAGVALYAYNADATPRILTVTNNVISDYQKNGMALSGDGLTADVSGNVVTGAGPTAAIAQNGIQIGYGAVGHVSANTVDGNSYTAAGTPDDYAAGILLFQPGAGTTVTANTLGVTSGNDAGIFLDGVVGAGISIEQNTINRSFHAGSISPTTSAARPSARTSFGITRPASSSTLRRPAWASSKATASRATAVVVW